MALAAIGFAKAMRRRQIMVATSSIGPGAMNMVTAAGRRDGEPAAAAAALGRHVPEPDPRPGAAAGRAFRLALDDGQRRVPRGHALLGPDRPPGAGRPVAARSRSRRCSTRPSAARPSSGSPRTSRRQPTTTRSGCSSRGCTSCAGQRPDAARAGRGRRSAPARRERPARRRGRRRPLLARRGRSSGASWRRTGCRSSRPSPGKSSPDRRPPAATSGRSASPAATRPTGWPPRPTSCSPSARACRTSRPARGPCSGTRSSCVDRPERRALRRGQAPRAAARGRRARGARRARRRRSGAGGPDAGWAARARGGGGRRSRAFVRSRHDRRRGSEPPTYAQVIGAVNRLARRRATTRSRPRAASRASSTSTGSRRGSPRSTASTASRAWATRSPAPGARRWPGRDGDVICFVGDGSYLMLNSELYSSVLTGQKLIVVVCDNGGFAVIDRLQTGQGGRSFNNMFGRSATSRSRSTGSRTRARSAVAPRRSSTTAELEDAFERARAADRTTVIAIETAPDAGRPAGRSGRSASPRSPTEPRSPSRARVRSAEGEDAPARRLVSRGRPRRSGRRPRDGPDRRDARGAALATRSPERGWRPSTTSSADARAARRRAARRPGRAATAEELYARPRSTRSRSARARTPTSTRSRRRPRRARRSSARSRSRTSSARSTGRSRPSRRRRPLPWSASTGVSTRRTSRFATRSPRARSATSTSCGSRAGTPHRRRSTTRALRRDVPRHDDPRLRHGPLRRPGARSSRSFARGAVRDHAGVRRARRRGHGGRDARARERRA